MGFLTTFYKYIIQQYFCLLAIFKTNKISNAGIVVHPQSDENVRLQWCF